MTADVRVATFYELTGILHMSANPIYPTAILIASFRHSMRPIIEVVSSQNVREMTSA